MISSANLAPRVVAGIVALFLHGRGRDQVDPLPLALLIYAELTAGISILLALNWVFSLTHHLQNFSVDFCMSVLWFIRFRTFHQIHGCCQLRRKTFDWSGIVYVTSSKRAKHSVSWQPSSGSSMLQWDFGWAVARTEAVRNLDTDLKDTAELERNMIAQLKKAHLS